MNETYAFIEAEKTTHGVAFLCRLLKVARSAFYAWLAVATNRSARKAADDVLAHEITSSTSSPTTPKGVPQPRRAAAPGAKREPQARRPRDARTWHPGSPPPQATVADPAGQEGEAGPDLIGRDFHAAIPGTKLVGDITACPPPRAGSTSTCQLELATREVEGYSMADHHRANLVADTPDMAHGRSRLKHGCVIHSDRGND